MAKSVKIWFKKQMRVDHLTIPQRAMLDIGIVGLAAVKNRVAAALGPTDSAAKELNVNYMRKKRRLGLGTTRNLTFTGNMLRNVAIRTIKDNLAVADLTARKTRIAGRANMGHEPWLVFSPRNREATFAAARRVTAAYRLLKTTARNNSTQDG